MKEEGSGFPMVLKWFSEDKQFWRKFDLKIDFFLQKTGQISKKRGIKWVNRVFEIYLFILIWLEM